MISDGISRVYHVPDEDDEVRVLSTTVGNLHIIHNALCLYCFWIQQRGTLPLEYGNVSQEQEIVLKRLRELSISPKQLAIELKAGTLAHARELKDLIEEELAVET